MAILCRRDACASRRRSQTGVCGRDATGRTTVITGSTKMNGLLLKRCDTECGSRAILLGRTGRIFRRDCLAGRKVIVSMWGRPYVGGDLFFNTEFYISVHLVRGE